MMWSSSQIRLPFAPRLLVLALLLCDPQPASATQTNTTQSGNANSWAFQPASRPVVPSLAQPRSTLRNPIDAFILERLRVHHLSPAPEADRATLLRRLTFDLTGLPPTPDDMEAFRADQSAQAYEKVVDRLLASPRYGERWARHWLDVVHFGETHGYDKDKLRPNAWPYRDYVIRAFNDDKPYSRFVQEQLAGDALFPDEPDGIVATGFIAAGPWDYVGHVELPITKTDGLIARYYDRDDMVMTTMSTFQSLTVHCARCHDHKFDPISQRDYYSLQAVFAGVDRANRPYDPDKPTHQKRQTLSAEKQSLETRANELQGELAKVTSPDLHRLDQELARVNAQRAKEEATDATRKSPSNGYHSTVEPQPDALKWVQVDLGRVVPLDEVRLIPAQPTDFPDTPGFGFPVRWKVEISDTADFTKARPIADYTSVDFKNPRDAAVIFSLSPAQGERAGVRGQATQARYLRVTASRLWERTHDYVFALAELQVFAGRTNVARGATVTALDSIEAGRWSRKNLVDGFSSRAALMDVMPTPAELAQRRARQDEAQRLESERQRVFDSLVPAETKVESARIQTRLAEVNRLLAALPAPKMVYAAAHEFKPDGSFIPPNGVRPVHLLQRGDVTRPHELMAPAGLPCLPGLDAAFHLPEGHPESAGRAALARWMTDPKNMLTRRSMVNRVWQYHFGRGLVDTPNDFGHMGALPTHPELLDWLAFWFLDHGESLKQLHRLIVTTAAYRRTSQLPPEPQVGRWESEKVGLPPPHFPTFSLSAPPAKRATALDAECIRDALLAVSGQLDPAMGGPSDRQFFFKDDHSPVYDYTRFDVDSKASHRRSIYRLLVRSVPDPFMDCLDCADPSLLVAKRNTTLTALQALATLNNPFVLSQCEHFAARLSRISSNPAAQIEAAYRLALGRPPTTAEGERLLSYAQQHGLANACRVLVNSNEFVFVD